MKIYTGKPMQYGKEVTCREDDKEERRMNFRLDLRNHSPDGFEWGYGGSGPAQLAIALLSDVIGDTKAQRYYQDFKWIVIAQIPSEMEWEMTDGFIESVINQLDDKEKMSNLMAYMRYKVAMANQTCGLHGSGARGTIWLRDAEWRKREEQPDGQTESQDNHN